MNPGGNGGPGGPDCVPVSDLYVPHQIFTPTHFSVSGLVMLDAITYGHDCICAVDIRQIDKKLSTLP